MQRAGDVPQTGKPGVASRIWSTALARTRLWDPHNVHTLSPFPTIRELNTSSVAESFPAYPHAFLAICKPVAATRSRPAGEGSGALDASYGSYPSGDGHGRQSEGTTPSLSIPPWGQGDHPKEIKGPVTGASGKWPDASERGDEI